jgi:hypothetical protein
MPADPSDAPQRFQLTLKLVVLALMMLLRVLRGAW